MTELSAVEAPDITALPDRDRASTKTKILTAAGLGGLGVVAFFAEKNGWVHRDWPPPMHSFKHPWIGYYSAWIAEKVAKRHKTSSAVALGQIANVGAKTAQGVVNHPHGGTFYWAHNQHHFEANLDNAIDFAVCLGGTALYLAQDRGIGAHVRASLSKISGGFSRLRGYDLEQAPEET